MHAAHIRMLLVLYNYTIVMYKSTAGLCVCAVEAIERFQSCCSCSNLSRCICRDIFIQRYSACAVLRASVASRIRNRVIPAESQLSACIKSGSSTGRVIVLIVCTCLVLSCLSVC